MRTSCKKSGFSLTEMVVVVAIVGLLAALGLPAIRSLQKSFETGSGINSLIDAALSSARAVAAQEQRYAGLRFQLDLHDNQYMIFIIHDPEKTKLSDGFRALEGQKPIKLPDDFRVIDMMHRWTSNPETLKDAKLTTVDIQNGMRDTSSFSIIFSPAGKMVIHGVRVRNRDGIYKPDNSVTLKVSMDDIFNSPKNVLNYNVGMFLQDDDWTEAETLFPGGGLGAEFSRDKFYIYEKSYFDKLNDTDQRLDYLNSLEPVFINQYTGTIVNSNK